MKRPVTQLSRSAADTPLVPRFDKKCRGHGLFGTPVDGLTDTPVDTPESQQRQRVIPDTTQRKLEGFCLNTPLTLSQALGAETPTLGKDRQHGKEQPSEQPAAAQSGSRHRLANISNLPNSPRAAAAAPDSYGLGRDDEQPQEMDCHPQSAVPLGWQQKQPYAVCGRPERKRPAQQVHFAAGLFSPPATLPAPGAMCASTPHPSSSAGASGKSCPGSAGTDDGFVLFMSQTYSRASQPAISPSVAAGLAVPETAEEGPAEDPGASTTPSQDSRERSLQTHSNVTFSNAAGAVCQQDDPAADAHLPLAPPSDPAAAAGPSRYGSNTSTTTAFDSLEPAGLARLDSVATGNLARLDSAATGNGTPGDALAAPLLGDLEETTTPELEQIGYSSQDLFSGSQQSAGAAGRARGAAAAAAAAGAPTSSRGRVVCEEVTTKQMMFPIFRPKTQRKCVILIRHGESEYNRRDFRSKEWSDPTCFDAPLTDKGKGQAKAIRSMLGDLLKRHKDKGSSLWLSSPLTRALDTMMLAYPDVQHLANGQHGAASAGHLAAQPASHRVVVLSSIAEQCATVGDVGRPSSELQKQFPALSNQLSQLPEKWWFDPCPAERPNCAMTKQFYRKEHRDQLLRRVSEFSRWLSAQEERLIVAFGHSVFWQQFARTPKKMDNCEIHQFWF